MIYKFVETGDEYRQVIELRHRAYADAGKISRDATVETMADIFDRGARVMICKVGERVVASLRLFLPEEGQLTEHGMYATFPASFPKWSECMEGSRFCIDKDYRRSNVFGTMCALSVAYALENGRRYIVSGGAGYLLKKYPRVGLQRTGITYRNESLGGLTHEIVKADCWAIVRGLGTTPYYWAHFYAEMARDLRRRGIVKVGLRARLRMRSHELQYQTKNYLQQALKGRRPADTSATIAHSVPR